jgi:diacylglycerol kinase family enzyme
VSTAPIFCILNAGAHSDAAEKRRDELADLFAKQGQMVEILVAKSGDQIISLTQKALSQNCSLLIAGGGDGTMNAVASQLVGTDTPMGVLPLGTLNHFAKDLGIPLKLEDAVANVFAGTRQAVDVGKVHDRIFLNNSSIGLYPGIVVQRETLQRDGASKWPAFGQALIYALWRYSSLRVRLDLGNETLTTKTPLVFIGNNRYEIKAPYLGQRKSLTEGRLCIYQTPRASRAKLLWLALRALLGIAKIADLSERDATQFWIRASARRLRVATDGEVMRMKTPLHYRILPRSLHVIVPVPE